MRLPMTFLVILSAMSAARATDPARLSPGTIRVHYVAGKLVKVEIAESSGNAGADRQIVEDVRRKWKPKAGSTGTELLSQSPFLEMPTPRYDTFALKHRYQGSGRLLISCLKGKIVKVSIQESTGNSYLDALGIAWVKKWWKVKSGATAKAELPVVWVIAP